MRLFTNLVLGIMTLCYVTLSFAASDTEDPNQAWTSRLKSFYFQERTLQEDPNIVRLIAPSRAEDPARVPVSIVTSNKMPNAPTLKTLYLIIDKNPSPLAGKFNLTPNSHIAQLDLFIRVNEYSPVRVIAETTEGQLYMQSQLVKASGGCSAPAATDMDKAAKEMGQMRFKLKSLAGNNSDSPADWTQASLAIKHPNLTGLQRDQISQLFVPAHYIKTIEIKLDNKPILSAETDISISENPVLNFDFRTNKKQNLTATITDTKGDVFTHQQTIGGATDGKQESATM